MTEPKYCLGCSRAVSTDSVVKKITRLVVGDKDSSVQWENTEFGICMNEDCPRYALLSVRVAPEPFEPIEEKKHD